MFKLDIHAKRVIITYRHIIGTHYNNRGVRAPQPYIAVDKYIRYSVYVYKLYFRFNG